jgi:hypothetical protein|tara:strand:- start:1149 stop:3167 length:2019 start_codon:yes stop_codon:yes gene_type:complete
MMILDKKKLLKILMLMTVLLLPFSVNSTGSDLTSQYLTDSTVGFYQTNTCEFSFANFAINNLDNQKIIIKNDFSSSINCFGKVNGVDIINESYYVYIGTNLTINIVLQSLFWIILISFIPKDSDYKNQKKYLRLLFLSIFFSIQIFSENRFYEFYNKQFNESISLDNYFFLSLIAGYFLITILCNDIILSRSKSFINYFPFLFLIIGTFSSSNNNFFLVAISVYAVNNLTLERIKNNYSKLYLVLLIFWLLNNTKDYSFFDVDKLRGFVSSSNSNLSLIYWGILFYLFINGVEILVKKTTQQFNVIHFKNSLLISGSIILFLGLLGAKSTYFNFFNFYFLGQNKTGMNTFESVAGNTWRGFAASAEAIGEFYGVVIIIVLFLIWKTKKIKFLDIFLLLINCYGLYKANDISVLILLIFIFCYLTIIRIAKNKKINLTYFSIFGVVAFSILVGIFIYTNPGTSRDYNFLSENIIAESVKSSSYFTNDNPEIQNFLNNSNYLDIVKVDKKNNILSSSTIFLIERYNPNFNLPIVPNPTSSLSVLSTVINRTEKWAYFIAKYNPDPTQLLFGNGPMHFNNYYFGHKVANEEGLILPHSSLLDILIYFGLLGVGFVIYNVLRIVTHLRGNIFEIISIFLFVNFMKSDSFLYISSFLLFYIVLILSAKLSSEVYSNE